MIIIIKFFHENVTNYTISRIKLTENFTNMNGYIDSHLKTNRQGRLNERSVGI